MRDVLPRRSFLALGSLLGLGLSFTHGKGKRMAVGQLDVTSTVTLNGSGNATTSIGPLTAREVWHANVVSVRATTGVTVVKEATCKVYVGDAPLDRNFRDGTFTGSSGDSTDRVTDAIKSGDKVWAVWSGGDAGAVATLVITGTKDI